MSIAKLKKSPNNIFITEFYKHNKNLNKLLASSFFLPGALVDTESEVFDEIAIVVAQGTAVAVVSFLQKKIISNASSLKEVKLKIVLGICTCTLH
jgi:hypothetical protein